MAEQISISDAIYQRGFHIIDNFLGDEDYRTLQMTIQQRQQDGSFRPAKIGHLQDKTHNANIRNDQIFWLDKQEGNSDINTYFSQLETLCETLNRTLYLGLVDYEAHFAIYQPNHFYKKHIDQFSTTQDRRISCVYYLNEQWQTDFGGELILYDKEDQPLINIMPLGNRFVCFESDMPHEVCISYQTRYSIAGWLKVRPIMM